MIFEKKVIRLFKKSVITRQNTPEELFLFSEGDFPGLKKEDFSFIGNRGQRLVGGFYYYGENSPTRVVIFEHGMGGGHLSYMREIEALASRGFTVLSYDHTGCAESEGEDIAGFSQSLADLDSLIKTLRRDEKYRDLDISVVGHSWGGYSTLNIAKYHPDITHIVAISGFVSVKDLLGQFLTGIMKLYIPSIVRYEDRINPGYAYSSAVDALKNSDVRAMIIHSADDPTVNHERHFGKLYEMFANRDGTDFVTFDGRRHNPNYTDGAAEYLGECIKDLITLKKAGELSTAEQKDAFREKYDWSKMTEQDSELWDKIRDFLNN